MLNKRLNKKMNVVGHYWIVNNYDLQTELNICLYMIEKLQTLSMAKTANIAVLAISMLIVN